MWIEQILLGWLALELTDSPWMVAFWGFFRSAPCLVGFFTPVLTDRFPRKELLLTMQGILVAGFLLLASLYWFGVLSYWHLIAVSVVNGVVFTVDWPTRRAMIPDLVGRERAIDAILFENGAAGLGLVLGPILGGMLLQKTNAAVVLVVIAVLLAGASVLLLKIRTASRAPEDPDDSMSVWLRLVEGLRYIRKLPRVYSILIATIFMNAWVFTFFPLLSVFARDILGRSEQDLGVMAGSYGLGALIGLCFVHHARRLCSDYAVLAGSCVLTCVVILGFSMSSFYSLSLVFLFLGGVGQAGFTSMQSGIILRDVSEEMRGRAMATLVLVIGAGPLGGLQSAVMVAWLGAPATVAILSASALLAVAFVFILLDSRGEE